MCFSFCSSNGVISIIPSSSALTYSSGSLGLLFLQVCFLFQLSTLHFWLSFFIFSTSLFTCSLFTSILFSNVVNSFITNVKKLSCLMQRLPSPRLGLVGGGQWPPLAFTAAVDQKQPRHLLHHGSPPETRSKSTWAPPALQSGPTVEQEWWGPWPTVRDKGTYSPDWVWAEL